MKVTAVAFVPYIKFHSLDAAYFLASQHPTIDAEALPEGICLRADTADGTEEIIVPWHEIRHAKSFSPKPTPEQQAMSNAIAGQLRAHEPLVKAPAKPGKS